MRKPHGIKIITPLMLYHVGIVGDQSLGNLVNPGSLQVAVGTVKAIRMAKNLPKSHYFGMILPTEVGFEGCLKNRISSCVMILRCYPMLFAPCSEPFEK